MKALSWLKQGAQPTDTAARLLAKAGIIEEPADRKEKMKAGAPKGKVSKKKRAKDAAAEEAKASAGAPKAAVTEEPKAEAAEESEANKKEPEAAVTEEPEAGVTEEPKASKEEPETGTTEEPATSEEPAEKDIKATGASTLAVKTDVSKAGDVEALVRKTLDAFGGVHLLCNNAGVGARVSTAWECTVADWEWVLGVNLWGVIHGVHLFVPIMLEQDTECHIVNTASMAGLSTMTNNSPYAVTKHGVVALSETLYRELEQGGYNVGVSVLCPGFVNTGIHESARNRPAELQNDPAVEQRRAADPNIQASEQFNEQGISQGMPPGQVADIVFSAIREKKFYILANAEDVKPVMQARMEDILQERNPTTVAPGME
ncbi:hypothetical protein ES708_26728 [subsurface metagenome]